MKSAIGHDGCDVDVTKCYECEHHEATTVFNLCKHASSKYNIAGKEDFHTIGHMRTRGACTTAASLFAVIAVAKQGAQLKGART